MEILKTVRRRERKKNDLIKFSEKKEMFEKEKNKLTCFVEVQQNHV